MRICWFNDNRPGLVEGDRVCDASKALEKLPTPTYPFPSKGDPLIAHLDRLKPAILAAATGAPSFSVSEVKFLSPVAAPTKIIGTPTNYRDHIAEADRQRGVFGRRYSGSIEEQGLFSKPPAPWSVRARGCGCAFPSAAPITRWSWAS
jgi:2-keto-4-pentenoate hydratase/2-oxohepta-3-ene-1,7-dioic acid hydratase in catechol pathway